MAQGGALNAAFDGDLQSTNFASVDKALTGGLLKWDSLYLGGVAYAHAPMSMNIEEIALSEFFSRVIISS